MISINGKPIEINKFPDGTLLIKEEPSYDIALISWYFENNEELVALIYLASHLRSHGVKKMELYMPYIPNARQDRVKKPEDVFTLKYFAGVINSTRIPLYLRLLLKEFLLHLQRNISIQLLMILLAAENIWIKTV